MRLDLLASAVRWGAVLTAAACIAAGSAAMPPRGSEAPPLVLADLDGNVFDAQSVQGRPYVLIFGELYHQPTREGCAVIERVLDDPRLAGDRIAPVLVIAQNASRLDLKTQAEALDFAGVVLHDPNRRAYEAYRVSVMPTVVVVGGDGRVIYSLAGVTPRMGDIVTDALLVGLGRLSVERFEAALHPDAASELSEVEIRAGRVTLLARQLARRGLDEMADEKYREAIALWPQSVEARLGLGRLNLKRHRIAEAEAQFRAVLAENPDLVEATLGVAYVQAVRGGNELDQAETLVREVLDRDPTQPRAHYLMGMILEQRNKMPEAAASYKRAAELLLERQGAEQ